jgi:predicted RNA methylase
MKLTKRQIKDNERIDAWVDGRMFQENARSKPGVPFLTIEDVLRDYTPHMPESTAQFFTPPEAAQELAGYVTERVVLDPCAGIGSLLYPLYECVPNLFAWEMDPRAYNTGKRLFPDVRWTLGNAFEIFSNEGLEKYKAVECVIMNPPFHIQWGLSSADRWTITGAKKSEHLFMELAIRAVVPGGIVLAILPSTFIDTLPVQFSTWFHERSYIDTFWPLNAKFKLTNVSTRLYHIHRKEN